MVKKFKWPLSNDNDIVYKRRVFYEPTVLTGTGPFEISSLCDIEKCLIISGNKMFLSN